MKVRDFGELLGTPFYFFRQEFVPLSRVVIKYAGPFLAVLLLLGSLFSNKIENISLINYDNFFTDDFLPQIILYAIVGGILIGLLIFSIVVIVLSYITLYARVGRYGFTDSDVWNFAKNKFFKLFGASLLIGGAGLVLSLFAMIPFISLFVMIFYIYAYMSISFAFIIICYEDIDVVKSVKRSFEVIKSNWWFTFGLHVVYGMIVTSVLYFMLIVLVLIIVGIFSKVIGSYIFITVMVGSVISFFVYVYFIILQQSLVASIYFSLITKKEGGNINERIDAISNDTYSGESLIYKEEKTEKEQENFDEKENKDDFEKKDGEKNRFLDDSEENRFKPKY